MTLTKAVDAAREAMTNATGWMHMKDKTFHVEKMEKALAALPDKPMTEAELIDKLDRDCCVNVDKGSIRRVVVALKAANLLYVSEEK